MSLPKPSGAVLVDQNNVVTVTLDRYNETPVSSYVVRIALPTEPTNYIQEVEIPANGSLVVQFKNLTNGANYTVTATSKLADFESEPTTLGVVTLCKYFNSS